MLHSSSKQHQQRDMGLLTVCAALQVGEHDGCGPGNYAASGFSYIPETFMAERIGVYNICWRDMGVPTLDKMMDIVQVRGMSVCGTCQSTEGGLQSL
jgi:protein tyrosine phosphatase domain-containing protein 1